MSAPPRVIPRQRPSKPTCELQPQSMEKIDTIIKKSRGYATTALKTLQKNGFAIGGHSLSEPTTPERSASTKSERVRVPNDRILNDSLNLLGASPTPISTLSYLVFEIFDGNDNTLRDYAVPAAERLVNFIKPVLPKRLGMQNALLELLQSQTTSVDWPGKLFEYFMVEWTLKHRKSSERSLVFLDTRFRLLEDEMVASAQRILRLLDKEGLKRDEFIFCIPATDEGMDAALTLKILEEPIQVNMVEVTSAEHALACVEMGVDFVTMHLGQDKGRFPAKMEHPAVDIIRDTARYFIANGIKTRVVASGFPSAKEVDLLVNDVNGVIISKDITEDIELCESDEGQDVSPTSESDFPVSLSPSVPKSFDYTTYDNKLQAIESRLVNEMWIQAKRYDLKKATRWSNRLTSLCAKALDAVASLGAPEKAVALEPAAPVYKSTLKRTASCMDVTQARPPKTDATKEPVASEPARPVYKSTLERTASYMDVTQAGPPKIDATEEPVASKPAAPVYKSTLKRTASYMDVTEARLTKKSRTD